MKRIAQVLAVVVLFTLGCSVAALGSGKHTANFGGATIECNKPITVSFTNFPDNHHSNTVSYVVKKNTAVVDSQTKTWTGGSSPTYTSLTAVNGTWQVTASWNTNGVSGSYDSGAKTLTCAGTTTTATTPITTTTQTTASTSTQTVTAPTQTQTVTTPGQTQTVTVTNTATVTVTAPAVTVTTPAPPAKIKVVTKWKKCPPIKHKPPTAKQKCLAGKQNGALWVNGRCEFPGKG